MRCQRMILSTWFLLLSLESSSQCPDRLLLLKKINELRSSSVPVQKQLKELLPFTALIQKCPQRNDSVRAFLLQRIGALYYLEHDYNNAVVFTKQAIEIYSNPAFLAKVYSYLQIFYDSLERVKDKMNAIDSSILFALNNNAVNDEVLYMLWQRVTYSFDIGDYQRCLNYAAMGEALTEKYGSGRDSLVYIATFFSNRINALIELKSLHTAEAELVKKISEYKARNEEKQCGAFYDQLAKIAIKENKYDDAHVQLENAYRCNKLNRYLMGCKQSLNNLGYFYFVQLNDPRKALTYYNRALKYKSDIQAERSLDIAEASNITTNIAKAYVRMGKFDSAFFHFQRAFDLLGKGSNENTLLEIPIEEFIRNPKIQYVTNLIRSKADAHLEEYLSTKKYHSLSEAIRIYKIADKVFTRIKFSQSELQSMLAWRNNAHSLYENAIRACQAGNKLNEAFYFFEKSRAVLLSDQINQNRWMADSVILKQAELNNRLVTLKNQLDSTPSASPAITEIQKSIFALTQEKDLLVSEMREHEGLQSGINNDSSFISLQTFRKNGFTDKGSLLELFVGDSAIYVMLITQDNTVLKSIDKRKYDTLTEAYATYVSDPSLLNSHFDDFVNTSHELFRLIFHDILLPEGRIVVSPDGRYFPFEALITNVNNNNNNNHTPVYFIEERAVSYTYSARYLMLNFGEGTHHDSPFLLGVAPIEYPARSSLAALRGSDLSLYKLASYFRNSHCILGSAATKNEFLTQFHKYKVVQLYTHASEKGKSGEPVIYFADSALYISDLVPVKQPATRLVILSACETAKGKFYLGEGVFGFNRAFAGAGIPSSMVNMWSVDNESTYLLTELFFKYLSRGTPSDQSLQKAKIEFLKSASKEKSLPFYWAATIIAGQTSAFKEPVDFPWPVLLSVLVMLVIFSLVVKKYAIVN